MRFAADERDAVMEAERDAQTIVTRTEIGSARGNTNCNLLHSYAGATQAVWPDGAQVIASVATSRSPATHPLRYTNFELCRWSTETK